MSYIMPAMILLLLGYALYKRVNVYEAFTRGAQEALPLLVQVLPFMAAMMIAMNLFRSSGALSAFIRWIEPLLSKLGIPAELVPLLVLRPFSGSAAIALLQDVFNGNHFLHRSALFWLRRRAENPHYHRRRTAFRRGGCGCCIFVRAGDVMQFFADVIANASQIC